MDRSSSSCARTVEETAARARRPFVTNKTQRVGQTAPAMDGDFIMSSVGWFKMSCTTKGWCRDAEQLLKAGLVPGEGIM